MGPENQESVAGKQIDGKGRGEPGKKLTMGRGVGGICINK